MVFFKKKMEKPFSPLVFEASARHSGCDMRPNREEPNLDSPRAGRRSCEAWPKRFQKMAKFSGSSKKTDLNFECTFFGKSGLNLEVPGSFMEVFLVCRPSLSLLATLLPNLQRFLGVRFGNCWCIGQWLASKASQIAWKHLHDIKTLYVSLGTPEPSKERQATVKVATDFPKKLHSYLKSLWRKWRNGKPGHWTCGSCRSCRSCRRWRGKFFTERRVDFGGLATHHTWCQRGWGCWGLVFSDLWKDHRKKKWKLWGLRKER